jgi:hypothetical protein
MAKPMTPDQWLAALRAEGVTDIVEMTGWRSNNRNNIKAFTDVRCTMIHHTAGEGSGLPRLLFDGRDDLPGPLCHDYLDRTGRLYLVGNGRANHAGTVAANAYAAVRDETPVHPYPDAAEPLDGNSLSYGLECENSGAEGRAWTAKQYDVAVRVQAARCRFHGWTANSVWAHKEATRRKPVDPRLPMDQFRADVAERLAHPAGWNPGDSSTPEEDDMPTAAEIADAVVKRLQDTDGTYDAPADAPDYDPDDSKAGHYWTGRTLHRDLITRVRRTDKAVAGLAVTLNGVALALSKIDPAVLAAAVAAEFDGYELTLVKKES